MKIDNTTNRSNAIKYGTTFVMLFLISLVTLGFNTGHPLLQQDLQATPTTTLEPTPTLIPTPENPLITRTNASQVTLLQSWQAHTTIITGLSFSPVQGQLVSAGDDLLNGASPVRIWDRKTGQPIEISFAGIPPFATITTAHFSQDGQFVIGNLGIGTFVWNAQTGSPVAEVIQVGATSAILTENEGNYGVIVAGEAGLVSVWSIQPTVALDASPQDSMSSPNTVYNVGMGALWTAFQVGEPISEIAFDPGSRHIFVLSQNGNLSMFLWELLNTTMQTVTQAPRDTPKETIGSRVGPRIAVQPNTNHVAFAGNYQDIVVYNYAQNETIARYEVNLPISCIIYNHTGELLIVADLSTNSSIQFLDANTGELVASLNAGVPIASCALSPDGTLLATGNVNGEIKLWGIAASS